MRRNCLIFSRCRDCLKIGKFSIPSPIPGVDVENLARQTTVRIQTAKSSGSGTIVRRQGQTYTVLTNWHVVAIVRGDQTIVTGDGLLHRRLGVPRRVDDTDLAIVEFRRAIEYTVAPISAEPAAVGEPLRSARVPCRCTGVGGSAGVRTTAAAQIFGSRLELGLYK